jgi:hypothetical protein
MMGRGPYGQGYVPDQGAPLGTPPTGQVARSVRQAQKAAAMEWIEAGGARDRHSQVPAVLIGRALDASRGLLWEHVPIPEQSGTGAILVSHSREYAGDADDRYTVVGTLSEVRAWLDQLDQGGGA